MPHLYNWREKPSNEDYPPLCTRLASLRYKAICMPLRAGLRFALDLQVPAQCSLPGARSVPTIFPAISPASSAVTLELDTALQYGLDGESFSQVWTATVVDVPDTRLVMKIVQPSLCFRPDSEDLYWFGIYHDPFDIAHNEAWVYQELAHLQGRSIPYFFGVFDITTPSGEAAWALVLEFIPGPTINTIAKVSPASVTNFVRFINGSPLISTDVQANQCELGLKTVQDLALSGWAHGGIIGGGGNYILNNSSDDPVVVILDLFDTLYIDHSYSKPPPSWERVAFIAAQRFFDTFETCVRDDCPSFFDWAQQNLPREVWDYGFDPEDPDVESEDDLEDENDF